MEIEHALVYYNDIPVGVLLRANKSKYLFAYYEKYLTSENARPLSLSLPLQKAPFESDKLFPFFEGTLSEGWLRKLQTRGQKIDENDTFRLLLENGSDLIGAVTIQQRK